MENLTAIAFPDKFRAEHMLGLLREAEKDGLANIHEAVVLVRDEDGRLRRASGLDEKLPKWAGAAGGAGIGLVLSSLVAGPLVLSAAAGAAIAHQVAASSPITRMIRQFRNQLDPGTSALFITGESEDVEALVNRLQPQLIDATVLKTSVPDELIARLQEAQSSAQMAVSHSEIKRVFVIINPAAGVERPILKPLNQILREAEIKWDLALTHAYGDARRHAAQAAADNYDAVVVYGGDGTVMEVASGLMGSDVPMAIIPGGTGNVMSVELGIVNDVRVAAGLLSREKVNIRSVDMGQVGEHTFALRVATGYEADYVRGTSRDAKERLGKLAYALSAIQQELRLLRYHLRLDGEEVEVEGYTCMVANSGNVGFAGLPLLRNVSVSDGLLDVIVVQNLNFMSMLRGNVSEDEKRHMVRHWQVREATVATDPPQPVIGDGEVWEDTPFTAQIIPAAVRVIVP